MDEDGEQVYKSNLMCTWLTEILTNMDKYGLRNSIIIISTVVGTFRETVAELVVEVVQVVESPSVFPSFAVAYFASIVVVAAAAMCNHVDCLDSFVAEWACCCS